MRAIIALLLLMVSTAEAAPRTIKVKLAVIGDAISWCDAAEAWRIALARLRAVSPRVRADLEFDVYLDDNRPDLRTLEHFWDGSLARYWAARIPRERGSIRWVALRPLIHPAGYMYGGQSLAPRRCSPRSGWFFTNAEAEKTGLLRNASVLGHELSHHLGASDHCDESSINGVPVGNERPHLLCWKYGVQMKTDPNIGYDWLARREIRRCMKRRGR